VGAAMDRRLFHLGFPVTIRPLRARVLCVVIEIVAARKSTSLTRMPAGAMC
jgi:hypothetical protein